MGRELRKGADHGTVFDLKLIMGIVLYANPQSADLL